MKARTLITALVSAIALPLAAAAEQSHHPASAEQTPTEVQTEMGGPMMMQQGRMMMGHGMMSGSMMSCPMMATSDDQYSRIEGRLAFLKAELSITQSQEQSWNTFAEAFRDSHEKRKAQHGAMHRRMAEKAGSKNATASAPDALKHHIQMLETMVEKLKSHERAVSELYDALNDTQKATADELLAMNCGMVRR